MNTSIFYILKIRLLRISEFNKGIFGRLLIVYVVVVKLQNALFYWKLDREVFNVNENMLLVRIIFTTTSSL